ncbi:MAG: tyrosine-type recombinase/integrase [Deltaproteobacteria bacterium]|nr:tyrosine-type recombinase/integrase [Deltaproteobacteria bacterium]
MATEWQSLGNGLQARAHETRKFGRRFDRFIRGRYMVDGRRRFVSFGWESEWVAGERARMKAQGEKGPRMSFVRTCQGEISRLKRNALKGKGPLTLKEDRKLAKAKEKADKEAQAEEKRRAVTFGEFFTGEYIPTAKTHKKPKTIKEEESIYAVWLEPNIGNMKLVDLRPLHIEKVKKAMLDNGKAPRRVQYALAVIRQTWNTARGRGLVQGDWPGKDVKVPSFDNRRMRFLNGGEADKLLAKVKKRSEQTHNISLISLDCGLRFGEIVKLQWGHVDTDNMTIRVVDPKGTKGTKSRTAFMTERVRDMFESMPIGKKTELVFKDRKHGRQVDKISHAFWRSVDKLELNKEVEDRRDRVVFHTLRHSYASNLVSSGADLYVVSQLLGHSRVEREPMVFRSPTSGVSALSSIVAKSRQTMQHVLPSPRQTGHADFPHPAFPMEFTKRHT